MTRASRLAVPAIAALLGACRAEQSVFAPRGPAAERLAELGGAVIGTFLIVALAMFGLILAAALRNRGTLDEHAPADTGGGHRWILLGGFAIPAIILAGVFIAALAAMAAFPLHDQEQGAHATHEPDIVITGHQWWWQAEYRGSRICGPARPGEAEPTMMTANELHIPAGLPVTIALRSADVIHSFWVPQLHGKVDLVPGQENRIRIAGALPGRYLGQCAEFCGAEHARMRLAVVVDRPREFSAWMAGQRAPAHEPESEQQRRGRALVEGAACALCHTIRGTEAKGSVGPDLTHLGSRATIAAGSYPNTHAWRGAWVTRAQSLKPGAGMPDMTVFRGEELHAVVEYLGHLK